MVSVGVALFQWVWHDLIWSGMASVGVGYQQWVCISLSGCGTTFCGCGMALMVVSKVLHGLSKCDVPSLGATCPR